MACNFLKKHALKILMQNYRCRCGEIDIIAQDNDTIIFIEVRFRKYNAYGEAYETVTRVKQKRIIKTATYFLLSRNLLEKVPCRFDVIGISDVPGKNPELTWIKNAFEA